MSEVVLILLGEALAATVVALSSQLLRHLWRSWSGATAAG